MRRSKAMQRVEQNVALLIKQTLGQAPEKMFWYCQVGFWVFIGLVSYGTLNIWFEQYQFSYFLHVILQSGIGLALSIFLQKSFIAIWYQTNEFRLWVGLALIFAISFAWTIARMLLFRALTGEQDIWWNFGGWYFSGIFIYLCWTAMFHGLMYYQLLQREHQILLDSQHKIQEEYVKRVEAQAIARDAQLKMLRYQLSPHFLSNALNSVNALIEMKQGELAQQSVVKLSKFLRYLLDHDPESRVTVQQEINALMLYLDIEKIRFGDRLSIDLRVDQDAEEGLIPSLLLQPIIENSMKHAISKSEDGGTIYVTVRLLGSQLKIELCDTGKDSYEGVDSTQEKQNRSIGMENIASRLDALYPKQHKLSFELTEGRFKTHITIPFERAALDA
ncbi:sensor histidine kinase [Thalassotalea agarivorans]|uniref:Histidine kinase n=1 Tax=Thalassotalea agarivorans TaxID=349064 RepID=A0A1I0FMC7_THASX|nr:histidine kinase [Thalassotalea agarivorans]SET59225.1 Histidine kinase [Thalassotalea agarivorans]